MDFVLDPRLAAATLPVAVLSLCDLRLQNDARFVWFVLIPRREGAVDLDDLAPADAEDLIQEVRLTSGVVRALMAERTRPAEKLNVASLGNVVPQLHVHVVGRRRDDPLWPDPVWGRGTPEPLTDAAAEGAVSRARALIGALTDRR